jgi:AcrR family transcriptional regulator
MGRREENKARKLAALKDAGLAVFSSEGYDRATIEAIASGAGVARGTYYLYFDDKLALFEAIVTPWVDDLVELVASVSSALDEAADRPAVREIYEQMGLAIALQGLNHRAVILLAFREIRGSSEAGTFLRQQEARILEAVTGITEQARDRGLIDVEDPAIAVRVIVGAVERLTFEVLAGEGNALGDPQRIASGVVAMFSRALGVAGY